MNVLDGDYESYPPHTRIPDDEILAVYAELTVNGEYALLPYEEEWRERGPLIKEWGYQLRRRYDIDWTPSWEDTNLNPFFCEDSIDSSVPNVIDAVRIHDDLPVAIKATLGWTTEASIAFLFTDGGAVEESRNHCVPILDTFIEGDIVYIVMPLLRPFNDPPFLAVAEVIDFIDQLVEGIEYMHQQGVAHRDITVGNIMMDASELYPEGFHPVRQNLSKNGMAEVVGVMRTHAPVRYYLIDFDSAIAFEKGTPSKYKYAEGRTGRDEEVPEFKLNEPYDPFKVDIYQFGNLLKKEFILKYTGVEFLEPLVREMTRPRPQERPNASALRVRFNTVRNRLSSTQMRTHLNLKDATDPFRERLLELGIDSLLESDLDDSPEHSSSEAPTTGNSNRSHDSYWSAVQSMESSITSQSSIEQPSTGGPLSMVTNLFTRSRSPSRPSSNTTPQESKGANIPWKPSKPPVVREPSPPVRTAPQPISSSRDQTRDNSPERSRLKTGRFPWSPSSSPDSVGSPILAVVNQFLQPDTSHTSEDVFKNDYSRPSMFGARATREPTPATFQQPPPPKASTPAAAPAKIRRNTVKTPPASAPAPPPAPAPAPAKAAPEANRRGRDGWGAINSPYGEAPAPAEYAFLGGGNTAAYGKQNKSSNAVPMFSSSNNYGWDAQAANEQASLGYFDMPQYEANDMDESSWMPEEALKYMNQPPPSMPIAPRPIEKKEQTPEKKSKLSKSPFASLSKKSAPSEPVTSTGTTTGSTLRTGLASKALFAAASNNRKSTIAVEDGTPFNTPPKTTVNLPSPTTTSPVTAKPKKSKSKKGSISETPKDVIPMKDDELSMPPIQDDVSSKVKRRGSGASTTSRPTSPMAIFLGSRGTTAGSKKEITKPSAAKPSSFKSGPFSWGVKPKASVPAESDWNTDNFSYGASAFTTSTGWKNKADEATSMAIVRSPVTTPNERVANDYDMASERVSTPPTKAGWKAQSYFQWDGKASTSSPQEEEEDLAQLMAQMTYPAEATPKAPVAFDFSEGSSAFQFTSSGYDKEGDDFWSGKFSKAAKNTAAKVEPMKPVEEAPPMFAKSKAAKSKVEQAPEPTPETKLAANKSKTKKGAAKTVSKSTIAVESPQPTPTTEAEEWSFNPTPASAPKTAKVEAPTTKPKSAWSFGSAAEPKPTNSWSFGASAAPPKPQPAVSKAEPVKQKSSEAYDDWFGVGKDIDDEEQQEEEEQPAPKADPTPEYDDWFSTSKPKATSKASKAAEVTSPIPSKPVKGRKGSKAEAAPAPEPVVVKTPEDTTPNVDEESQEAADDWFTPPPTKAAAKAKVTKSAWGAPKAKPTPEPVEEVKVPEVKPTEDDQADMDDWGFTPATKASTKAKPAKSAWGAASKVKPTPEPVEEITAPEVPTPTEEKEDVDDWWSAPTKGKKGNNAKAAKVSPPAANKWESINFGDEEPTAANDDLAADLAATLGDEEPSKTEEAPKPSESEAAAAEKEKEAEKPAAKGNAKGNAKKKKGKK